MYTVEMVIEDSYTGVGIAEKYKLRQEICSVLADAGAEGMTPTQLNEVIDKTFHPECPHGYYALQKVVGNVRPLIARNLVKKIKVDTGKTVETTIPESIKMNEDFTWEKIPAHKEVIPVMQVMYVWTGSEG